MSAKSMMLDVYRSQGRADALALRQEADKLTDTEIIDREACIPPFDPQKDYTGWRAGSPVSDEDQVWKLLQPHNASHYTGRPSILRSLWGLCHTKNPAKAKPWVDPLGTSGMYMTDECYRDGDTVYRCKQDNMTYDAKDYPTAWEVV